MQLSSEGNQGVVEDLVKMGKERRVKCSPVPFQTGCCSHFIAAFMTFSSGLG